MTGTPLPRSTAINKGAAALPLLTHGPLKEVLISTTLVNSGRMEVPLLLLISGTKLPLTGETLLTVEESRLGHLLW
jgi:hypothetical protein